MTQIISRQINSSFMPNNEEDNWDDIEFPEAGLLIINDDNDYGLSTTTRDMSEITINDSSDEDSEEDYCFDKSDSSKSTPASSPSSINKVKEIMINNVAITNNKEEFSGLITRIGGENNRVIAVGDDWDNDMEIPEDGFTNLTIATNKKNRSVSSTITVDNNLEFENWDEEEEQDAAIKNPITSPGELIIKRIKDPLKVLPKSNTARSKSLESFDDDFDFSGIDLNKLDFSAKALKSHQEMEERGNSNDRDLFGSERHSSRNSSRLSILPSPAPTNCSFESGEEEEDLFDGIQFPEHMDSLTLTNYNEDDNFENGLDISSENVFDLDHLKNKNIITRPSPTQQKRTRRESFTIEFSTSPKDCNRPSTSVPPTDNKAHPKTTSNNSEPLAPLHKLKANNVSSKSLTSSRTQATTMVSSAAKNTSKSTSTKGSSSRPKSPQNSKHSLGGVIKKPMFLTNNTFHRSKSVSGLTNFTSKQSEKSSKKIASTSNNHPKSAPKTNQTVSMPFDIKKRYQPINQNNKPNIIHNNTSNTVSDVPNTAPNNITPNAIPNSVSNANSKTNSNTNSTLEIMRKPNKQQSFGDGTELDGFDDLPINIEKERSYTSNSCTRHDRRNSVSSVGSKTDNSDNLQHHRKHKKNRKRKKPQLIRNLNVDKNPKVIGEMVYNPMTKRWDGNDSVLKDFDNALTSPIRPALISNMNNRTTNAKSFQVVGKMKFDPIKMCWNNDSSDDDEDIWAKFDHDDDDGRDGFLQTSSDNSDNGTSSRNKSISLRKQSKHQLVNPIGNDSNDFQVGSEFDITPGFLAALLASERQHRNEITRWYPDALSKKNDSRFGLRDITLRRSYLYDLRNNNKRNVNNSSSGNNSKIHNKNRSGGLFEAAKNLTRYERRHFK